MTSINSKLSHQAIVLGGHTTALYVVRSFGRCGTRVALINDRKYCEPRYSRYCSRFLPVDGFSTDSLLETIQTVTEDFGPCVIYPTNDATVRCLSEIAGSVDPRHVAMVPSWEITRVAYDKRLTNELAQRCDVPIPDTIFPETLDELKQFATRCRYPVVIKPTTTVRFRAELGVQAIAAANERELVTRFRTVVEKVPIEELLVQSRVLGPTTHFWDYASIFHDGSPVFEYVTRRRRQYPSDFGSATNTEVVWNATVAQLSARLLSQMGFWGISQVQFKYDAEREEYLLLDINPRFWKSCTITDLFHANMPLMAYQLRIGMEPTIATAPTDGRVIWIDALPDLYVGLGELISGRTAVSDWWQSYRGALIDGTFSIRDPLPGLWLAALSPFLFLRGVG